VNRICVPPETRDSIPAASTSPHQPAPARTPGTRTRTNRSRPVRQARTHRLLFDQDGLAALSQFLAPELLLLIEWPD